MLLILGFSLLILAISTIYGKALLDGYIGARPVNYQAQRELDVSINNLEQILNSEPKDSATRELLVSAYWQSGQIKEAFVHNKTLLGQKRDDPEVNFRQGIFAQQMGQTEAALKYFGRAVELDLDSVQYASEFARTLVVAEDYDMAIAQWRRVLGLLEGENVKQAQVLEQIADIYVMNNELGTAESTLNEALAIDPDNAHLSGRLNSLGKI